MYCNIALFLSFAGNLFLHLNINWVDQMKIKTAWDYSDLIVELYLDVLVYRL